MVTKIPDTGWLGPEYYRSRRIIDGRYLMILDEYPTSTDIGIDVTFEDRQRATCVTRTFSGGKRKERAMRAEAFLFSLLPEDCGLDRSLPTFCEAFATSKQRKTYTKTKAENKGGWFEYGI